jgi:serine O-acetyltransferase
MMSSTGNVFIRFYRRIVRNGIKDAIYHFTLYIKLQLLLTCSCHVRSKIPQSAYLPHPVGIVIGSDVIIGENVHIYQNVTLTAGVTVKDDARILKGAIILNNSTINEGAIVGAHSVVLDDVDEASVVAGIPAYPIN